MRRFALIIATGAVMMACSEGADNPQAVDGGAPAEPSDGGFEQDAGSLADVELTCRLDCMVQRAARALDPCAFPVLDAFDPANIDPPARNSDAYQAPDAAMLDGMRASFAAFVDGEGAEAAAQASAVGYLVCRSRGSADLVLWRPLLAGRGHPLIALRTERARPMIVEAPHPNFDVSTGTQAVSLFDGLRLRALIVSGTHRCASRTETACDGETSVCGAQGPYRVSDAAHDVDSFFHVAHVAIAEAFTTDWVVSLHGMSGEGISVSEGSGVPVPDSTAVAAVGQALAAQFPNERVTTCNPYRGGVSERRLCGGSNVQGRHINGASNACTEPSTRSGARFVHIEQSRSIRGRAPEVMTALGDALR